MQTWSAGILYCSLLSSLLAYLIHFRRSGWSPYCRHATQEYPQVSRRVCSSGCIPGVVAGCRWRAQDICEEHCQRN